MQTIMIISWCAVLVILVGAVIFGIKLRKSRAEAHEKWLKDNNLTEEQAKQMEKEYLDQEKKKKSVQKQDKSSGLAFLALSFKDRKVIVETGKFFRDKYAAQDPNSEICCCFRRIASYPYVWVLDKQDIMKAVTAMESISRMRKVNTAIDPKGRFADIDNVIVRLKSLKSVQPLYS